ncbi:ATP-binding protein [Streptomyces sp. NPDC007861]|uniref:ATP-binding protein n=1 Tax=Streptomyces sp. NPDC007861 TaxID=3154893 RepID=UPI00340240A2
MGSASQGPWCAYRHLLAIFDHLDHVPALDPIPITLVQRFALVCQLLDERENSHEFLFWPIHRQRLTPGWRWPAAVQRDWLPVTRDSAVAKPITRKSRAFEVAFAPDPACVARARQITGAFLEPCNANGELAENIVLAVSELVTNAIEHGTGEVGLRIRYSDSDVRIEVTDGNPTPPKCGPQRMKTCRAAACSSSLSSHGSGASAKTVGRHGASSASLRGGRDGSPPT